MGNGCISAEKIEENANKKKSQISVIASNDDGLKTRSWFTFLYGRYFPKMVIERFSDPEAPPISGPERQFFQATCAFVDISGFTKLSEKLAIEYGENGAEMLNKFISGYFDKLIDVINQWSGDIIKFAGDAMLVVWRNQKSVEPAYNNQLGGNKNATKKEKNMMNVLGGGDESLSTLVMRAVACNLQLIENLNNFSPTPGISLSMHSGIGVGELSGLFVGGVQNSWEFFVAGPPIQQMSDAGEEAKSGEVVISHEAYKVIESVAKGKVLPSGNFLITSLSDSPQIFTLAPVTIPSNREETLLSFIPRLVRRRVEAGQQAAWLAEYRRVYIMFVKLPAIDYADPDVMLLLQGCVCAVQESIFQYEGMVARLLADDKGTRFKIAFGMPANTHEDDPERVVLAAMDIQRRLAQLATPTSASIGIATGIVFCGEAGSSKRCEYTAVGYKVNMAARLMQAAGKGILVEQVTYDAAHARGIEFDRLPPIKVKGMAEPVNIYRPIGKKTIVVIEEILDTKLGVNRSELNKKVATVRSTVQPKKLSDTAPYQTRSRMQFSDLVIGRSRERNFIRAFLSRLSFETNPSILLLEGDGGVGKSVLILDALQCAESSGVKIIVSGCTLLDRVSPYYCFRSLLDQACALESTTSTPIRTKYFEDMLQSEDSNYLALLNSICNTDFESTPMCNKLSDDSRAKLTRTLLISIFTKACSDYKSMIVIEDLNWMDGASWSLLLEMIRSVQNMFFILSCRPFALPLPPDVVKLQRSHNIKKMNLEMLTRSDTQLFACNILGVKAVPSQLESFIFSRTKGHPLFIEEIIQSLISRKLIAVNSSRECVLLGFNESAIVGFPDSVEGMIVDRIDHLPPGPELTIKVCGVIGNEFSLRVLADVHPTTPPMPELLGELEFLIDSGFIQQDSSTNIKGVQDANYSFKNGFFQEVAYNLLLLAQRKTIHRMIVDYYEFTYNEVTLTKYYAFHLEKAEEWWRALQYAQKAVDDVASNNVSVDVCGFYRTIIRLLLKFPLDQIGPPASLTSNARVFRAAAAPASSDVQKLLVLSQRKGILPEDGRSSLSVVKKVPEIEYVKKSTDSDPKKSSDSTDETNSELGSPQPPNVITDTDTTSDVSPGVAKVNFRNSPLPDLPTKRTASFRRQATGFIKKQIMLEDEEDALIEKTVDTVSIRQKLEKNYICLAELLFSKGRYEEALTNFKLSLESTHPDFFALGSKSTITFTLAKMTALMSIRRAVSSSSKTVPDNVFQLTSLVNLLFRATNCCLYESSELSILTATYFAFKSVELADTINNTFITTQAYALAAYCSLLTGKPDTAANFYEESSKNIIENETDYTGTELSIVKMKLALYMAPLGDITRARLFSEDAIQHFVSVNSHRKLREAYLLHAILDFFQGNFKGSMKMLGDLLKSAQEDGDIHLESDARKWISVILMLTKGYSKDSADHLETAREVFKDERKIDFTLDVCSTMNEYYRSFDTTSVRNLVSALFSSNDVDPNSSERAYRTSHNPVSFSSDGTPIISEWQNASFFVILTSLLLDCIDYSHDGISKKNSALTQARQMVVILRSLCRMFPIYSLFTDMMDARIDWLAAKLMGAVISMPIKTNQENPTPPSNLEVIYSLQRSAISKCERVLLEAPFKELDYLTGYANYHMYLWIFNEPPPPPLNFFQKLFSCGSDPVQVVDKVENSAKSANGVPPLKIPKVDSRCELYLENAKSHFLSAGVEFFHQPSLPLLHTRDAAVLVSFGFDPNFDDEVSENNEDPFSFENKVPDKKKLAEFKL